MRFVALDTETYLIRPGRMVPRLVCMSTYDGKKARLYTRKTAFAEFDRLADDPSVIFVIQNAAFDMAVFAATSIERQEKVIGLYESNRIRCTKVREKLISIALGRMDYCPVLNLKSPGFDLATLVKRRFGVDISEDKKDPKAWRLRYSELDGVPLSKWPKKAKKYAKDDAIWHWKVFQSQREDGPLTLETGEDVIDKRGRVTDELPQVQEDFALFLASAWGLRTEAEAVDRFDTSIAADVAKGFRLAKRMGFLRDDGSKIMENFREVIYHAYKGKPPTTDKGNIKTDEDTLKESNHKGLIAYSETTFAQKQHSTYAPILLRGLVHPINARYDVLKETGRTSSYDPNIQNPPRKGDFRRCFIPRDGCVFIGADYDTIELRALAQVHLWWFGTSALADALNADMDPHYLLASELLGWSYEKILRRAAKNDEEALDARQFCKIGNFGFPGGLGPDSFVDYAKGYGYRTTRERAAELRDAWFSKWVEMTAYFNIIGQHTRNGSMTVIQPVSGRQRGNCSFTVAANSYFQGLCADGAKKAFWNVSRRAYGPMFRGGVIDNLWGIRPVIFMHDEIIAEGQEERSSIAADELAAEMVRTMKQYIPDVTVKASPVITRRWLKGAKPIRDTHGLLRPSKFDIESKKWVIDI